MVRDYLMGERAPMTDLMAWNADATRMPYRMHSEYLRRLFLDNDLAEGRYRVGDRPIALSDIRAPIFAVGTDARPRRALALGLQDSPADRHRGHLRADQWRPQRRHRQSEPGHPHRHFQVSTTSEDEPYTDPESWEAEMPRKDGSWWPEWVAWLEARSGRPAAPPAMGAPEAGYAPLGEAPGTYVLQR